MAFTVLPLVQVFVTSAYNLVMLHEWSYLIAPAVQDRSVLLLNHVISRERHALARLAPFAGSAVVLHLRGWPSLLPPAPDLVLGITPAGLFERQDSAPLQALRIELEASNPALMAFGALTGSRPQVTVQGDAALAGEINWLMENLRWDVEDDLAAIVGPAVAHQLGRFAAAAKQGVASLAQTVSRTAGAWRPGGSGKSDNSGKTA